MEKKIYDILNEVEINLEDYKKEELSEVEKKRMKNNFNKGVKQKVRYKKAATAVAAIAIVCTTLFGTNLGVYASEGASLAFYNISNYLGIDKDLQEYTTVVNKAITKNGITVQLNEVILDKDDLVIYTTSSSDEKIENGYIDIISKVYINGKKISTGGSGSSKQIDDYTVEEVMKEDLNTENLTGDLDVKIVFDSAYVNEDTKKGPWVFEFRTNGDELAKNTIEIPLRSTFTLENGQNITLKKYTSNDIGQKIYYSKDVKGTTYNMVLRGHDDLSNAIEFYVSTEKDGQGVFKLETIDGNLDENAKILSLTPYAVKLPEESGKLSDDFEKVGEEFTIVLTK